MFDVTAKQYGDSVKFPIEVEEKPNDKDEMAVYRNARQKAKEQARTIFDYKGVGDDPTISVKPAKDQVVE